MSRRSVIILTAVVIVCAALIVGLVLAFTGGSTGHPAAKPTHSGPQVNPESAYCYIEVQAPRTPTLWLQTPKQGTSEDSCNALDQAAEGDAPSGSVVFLSGRPNPAVVITSRGGVTVLAQPGTVSPQLKKTLIEGFGRLLPNG